MTPRINKSITNHECIYNSFCLLRYVIVADIAGDAHTKSDNMLLITKLMMKMIVLLLMMMPTIIVFVDVFIVVVATVIFLISIKI